MTRVLVVTADVLRAQMAGPAMRAWNLAEQLAKGNEVRLITTSQYCELASPAFQVASVGSDGLAEAEQWCDLMVLQGYVTHHHPNLAATEKIVVIDMYDPLHLETLALTSGMAGQARADHVKLSIATLNAQLERADFIMCASGRQRDLFLGQLCALGRVNPLTYDADPTLRQLIDEVPFGLPDHEPVHTHSVLRGVVPGISPGDDLLIWAGGVYNWFDPLTLVRAVSGLSKRRPSVRLYFMGLRHPNPDVPEMQMANAARALAEELGVAGRNVFFNDGWVAYSERQDYLMEADLGVTMHFANAETRFAFRTRALDYLWAGLPVVSTEGDSFAELVQEEGLGLTVPAEDPDALEEALGRLLSDRELAARCRARSREV
ncbi:MAG TPA: glycosyltransferase family 4 protein, partial [Acidimicrobiales bacterium]|nr:glycosyltransferase family 4 protein [Acidimicrobiales bacterium]